MGSRVQELRRAARRWLTAPEPRAAGRMGIFRVLYAAFYLWHLSWVDGAALGLLPYEVWQPVDLVRLVPLRLPSAVPGVVESCLVAALVLLLVGLRVRVVTPAVLLLGTFLEAFHQSFGKVEHGTVFLAFYIPLFMLGARWGDTWSLDAWLARRAEPSTTSPSDDSWRHALPLRANLVVLALLFSSAAFAKGVVGDWLTAPDLVTNLLLGKNVEAVREGLPPNPIAPFVVTHPVASASFRYGVLLFEAAFPLVLLGGGVRATYLAAALIFHALSALLLIATFTPILIVYALFVDWQGWVDRSAPSSRWIAGRLERTPASVPVVGTLALAVLAAWSWNATPALRAAVNLGGHLDWRTIWYPVSLLAGAWWLRTAVAIVGDVVLGRPCPKPARHGSPGPL